MERGGRGVPVEQAWVAAGGGAAAAGWRLIARLRHRSAGTVVEPLPGAELDEARWRWAEPRCERCGLRRRRGETYLLEHRSGRLAQVGTSCLRDFTGHDPRRALLQASCLADAASGLSGGAGAATAADDAGGAIAAADYLAHVAALARERGFTPVSQAHVERPATAGLAVENLRARRRGCGTGRGRGDRERARAALPGCAARWRGSATRAATNGNWSRCSPALALAAARPRACRAPPSGPLGGPGERVEVGQALLERVRPGREARFGASFAHSFRDQRGRGLVWFAVGRQLVPGERYRLRATVIAARRPPRRGVSVLTCCGCEWLSHERGAPGG